MRGTKETLGGMKAAAKAKGRTVGKAAAGAIKGAAKTAGRAEAGHGGLSPASRKATTKKGGASK